MDLGDTEYGIPLPMEGTCEWIHRTQQFTDWLNDSEKSRVLCVRGSLGSGKSTLMRYVVNFLRCSPLPNERTIAAFYTSSSEDGPSLKPPSEIYRSLLVQILQKPCFMVAASKIVGTHKAKLLLDKKAEAPQQELCSMLKDVFRNTSCEKTYIFLDAVDKCSDPDELIQFFQDMVAIAPGGMFKLCFTTQQSFPVIQSQCDQICLEDFNHEDIALFVDRRLLVGSTLSQESHSYLKQLILEKASGIFLWVIVVINHLRRLLIEGMDVPYLCATLDETPERLTDLYGKILTSSVRRKSPTEIRTALRVLQWVLLSARPLSLDEWHHVFAFIENMDLRSIKEWRKSKTYRENSFLLLQRVQSVCFGLVDVKDRQLPFRPLRNDSEASSLGVGAGSFESHQSIDVIHGSIRNFFLKGDGFLILDPDKECPIDYGHGYIRDVCIRYSCLEEMETAFQMNSTDGRKRAQRMGAVARSCKEAFSPPPTSYKYTTMPRGVAKKSTLEEDDDALETLSLGSSAGTSIRSVPPEKLSVSESFLGNSGSVSNLKLATNEEIPVKRIVSDYLESLDFDAQPSTPNTRTGIESVIHAEIAASCFQPLRIVEEPPCLWQYCRDMLVYHAVRADKAPTSPDKILEFLLSSKTRFNTWRMAREDMQYGATIEYFAAQWNLVTWLRFLKSQKSNLNSYGGLLSYPIIIAARKDNVEAFQYLSASFLGGARDLRFYSDSDRRSVLHHAALRPNSKVLSYMFKAFREFTIRPLINCADSKGCTPLHLAASYATNAEVRKLVRMGSDVNIANQNGNTPLHLACLRENPDVEICATLVEAGCNCELQNIDGKTAEQVVRGHEESTLTSYLMHESCYEENELCEYFANYFE